MIAPEIARQIMGRNVIGVVELIPLMSALGRGGVSVEPMVSYSTEQLLKVKDTHLLILGQNITIREMRDTFGLDPKQKEPCFYNQDWYIRESFMDQILSAEWFLISKEVGQTTRGQQPDDVIHSGIKLPSAIQSVYAFFAYYCFTEGTEKLWEYDFVWCCDKDHNGDRIYVGKYTDIRGVNKSGFSIHRNLALRSWYGAAEII